MFSLGFDFNQINPNDLAQHWSKVIKSKAVMISNAIKISGMAKMSPAVMVFGAMMISIIVKTFTW